MQQVKLFKSVEADITDLQNSINDWLRELQQAGGEVLQIVGNIAPQTVSAAKSMKPSGFSPSDLFVMVLYKRK